MKKSKPSLRRDIKGRFMPPDDTSLIVEEAKFFNGTVTDRFPAEGWKYVKIMGIRRQVFRYELTGMRGSIRRLSWNWQMPSAIIQGLWWGTFGFIIIVLMACACFIGLGRGTASVLGLDQTLRGRFNGDDRGGN